MDPEGPVYEQRPAPGYAPPPPRHEGGHPILAASLVAVLVSVLVGGIAGLLGGFVASRFGGSGVPNERITKTRVVGGTTDEPVAAAAGAALPSVVNIDVSGTPDRSDQGRGELPSAHPDVPIMGSGSGVAFRRVKGGGTYVLTNDHVVADADTIVVTNANGDKYTAKVVGRDEQTDIAVVQIKENLPVLDIADSEELKVGQAVIAIGSPFGLEHSVTSGVVSALHRSLQGSGGDRSLVDVIQTDAAINPGNSGGALIDRRGRLVGLNSAVFSEDGENRGIGFAIPVNTVVRIADELISSGKAKHPFIGVVGQNLDQEEADKRGVPVKEGALVVEVTKGSEAAKAGIKAGDVIVKVDDTAVRSMDDLVLAVRRKKVGDDVEVTYYRKTERKTVSVGVGDRPKDM